jgi:predicted RNase H-like HicB family nuclease
MAKEYTVIIEKGTKGNLLASVVELPGCHTQARTVDALIKNIKEAIELYLEVEKPPKAPSFLGIQRIYV